MVQALHGREKTGGAAALATADAGPAENLEVPPAHALFGDRYSIEKEIGRGGMGRVFAALDLRLGRRVAVKVLAPGVHGDEQLRRFQVEARAAASLHQPNILDVYDVGVDAGEPYIVSELLEGGTLRERLSAGPLPAAEAVGCARQFAAGLAAAHANGVVHRDLKPENLFITRDGRVKILDFGIAKLLPSAAPGQLGQGPPTDSGRIVGTTAYMSPEQVRGAPVDPRSDVFSFGAILHEMLAGAPAFAGDSAVETGYAVLSSAPASLPDTVPRDLVRIVSRCLQKDPTARYEDAAALARDLESVSARPSPWWLPRRSRIVPWVAACLAAGAVLAISRPRSTPPALPQQKTLAVLPFRSLGGGPPQEAFAAGLSEILTNKLRQLEQFQRSLAVVSANEVLKEKVTGAREAQAAFGATLVLGGSVHWGDASALVGLNLVETNSQMVVAARDMEIAKDGLGQLQPLLVQKAAEMLDLQLQPSARRVLGGDATSAAAYEFYLQGRGYLQRYDRVENVESALRVFEEALGIDSRYALAHAGKAEAYLRMFQITRDADAIVRAEASAQRAVELNDQLAPVHVTLGLVQMARGQHASAIASLQQALALEPRDADALRELANSYDAADRTKDAEETFRRAIELRQNSWVAYKDLALFLNRHGRLAESIPFLQHVVALTPDSYVAYSNLGAVLFRLGRHQAAAEMLQRSLALRPSPEAYSNLGTIEYVLGHYPQASDFFQKATTLNPADDRLWGHLADSYRWTKGREKDAVAAYQRAVALTDEQVAIDSQNGPLRSRRAQYSAALGLHDQARDDIGQALRLAPHDGVVRFRAGLVYEQAGRRDDALRELRAALENGFPIEEIAKAPPLRALQQDERWAQLMSERSATGTHR